MKNRKAVALQYLEPRGSGNYTPQIRKYSFLSLQSTVNTYSSAQVSAHFGFGIINSANSENVNERGIKPNSYKWEIAGGWALPVSTCALLQEVFKQAGAAQIGDKEGSAVGNLTMWRFIGLKGAVQRKLQQTQ